MATPAGAVARGGGRRSRRTLRLMAAAPAPPRRRRGDRRLPRPLRGARSAGLIAAAAPGAPRLRPAGLARRHVQRRPRARRAGLGARARGGARSTASRSRCADLVLADTWEQAAFYGARFGLPRERLAVVPVGAVPEPQATGAARTLAADEPLIVFQYGKWSPLHGAETVLAAAERLRDRLGALRARRRGAALGDPARRDRRAAAWTNVEWLGMLDARAAARAHPGRGRVPRRVRRRRTRRAASCRPRSTRRSPAGVRW